MLDLNIERLQIEIDDAAGHEHRIGGIAQRAAALLAEQIEIRYGRGIVRPSERAPDIMAKPVQLDLNRTGDEQVAHSIANAWLEALAIRLRS